jgi:hypothetical protein
MNERIKELAEQATTKISFRLDPNTYKHIDDPEGDFERVEFDKQKFAELIVRECARLAIEKQTENDVSGIVSKNPAKDFAYALVEHFGVEE